MAIASLLSNKLRSMLTMLGIIIGVGSVIALQSIGEGTVQNALASVQRAGTNLITVSGGSTSFGGITFNTPSASLTTDDVESLSTDPRMTAALAVSAEYGTGGQIVAGSRNTFGQIVGTTPTYPDVRDLGIAEGEWFGEGDVSSNRTVVVLGSTVATQLFPDGGAVGQTVRLNRTAFTVVAVLNSKGGTGFGSLDAQVYVPITTAQTKIAGPRLAGNIRPGKSVSAIVLKANNQENVELLISQTKDLLRELHKLAPGQQDDFQVTNQQDQLQAARDSQNTLNIFLVVIASISLFVGGIGIMNIMLVTVTERTREIGIRKAIGAKPGDILTQFMIESVTLCFIGGIIGVGAGIIASLIVGATFVKTAISLPVIGLAVVFAVAVGLFFGIYPARRASRLNPIEALRYE
jgi:putative ABC transport system permease protein